MGVRSGHACPFAGDPAFPICGRALPYVLFCSQLDHGDTIDYSNLSGTGQDLKILLLKEASLALKRDLRLVIPFQVAVEIIMSLRSPSIGVDLQEHGQRPREHHTP